MEANNENREQFNSPDEFKQAEQEQVEQPGEGQVEQPDRHEFEREADPNKEYTSPDKEEAPAEEHPATLNNLDADFQANTHNRTTGRMLGHEPGIENNL